MTIFSFCVLGWVALACGFFLGKLHTHTHESYMRMRGAFVAIQKKQQRNDDALIDFPFLFRSKKSKKKKKKKEMKIEIIST